MTQKRNDDRLRQVAEMAEQSELSEIAQLWHSYSRGDITLEEYNTIMRLNFPSDEKRPTSH